MSNIALPKKEHNKRADNAVHFLDLLHPRGPLFGGYHLPGGWVFRGQRNASNGLNPSAYRRNAQMMHSDGYWVTLSKPTLREQIWHEAVTLMYFSGLADQNGLMMPEDTFANRKLLRRVRYGLSSADSAGLKEEFESGELRWLPDDLLSLAALAQHYGLPTRLLDWSHDPYTAAYFAVVKAAEIVTEGKTEVGTLPDVCVWGLSILHLKSSSLYGQDDSRSPEVVTFTAPAATNANLAAQRGWFTLHRPQTKELGAPFQPRPLEEVLNCPDYENPALERPILYKISLRASEAPHALRLLAHQFVNGARLYPGFDGVVKGLKERLFWDARSQAETTSMESSDQI